MTAMLLNDIIYMDNSSVYITREDDLDQSGVMRYNIVFYNNSIKFFSKSYNSSGARDFKFYSIKTAFTSNNFIDFDTLLA